MSCAVRSMPRPMPLFRRPGWICSGSTLFLVGREVQTGEYVQGANPCAMCKRMIINAGIETVVIRDDKEHFRVYNVHNQYILQDESLEETRGY